MRNNSMREISLDMNVSTRSYDINFGPIDKSSLVKRRKNVHLNASRSVSNSFVQILVKVVELHFILIMSNSSFHLQVSSIQ